MRVTIIGFAIIGATTSCAKAKRPEPAATNSVATAAPAPRPSTQPTASESATPAKGSLAFDNDAVGAAPKGFEIAQTGEGAPPKWVVEKSPDAPSGPNVVVQRDADATNMRFPLAVAATPVLANASVSVRCKMLSGKVDQACGLVFRYQDAKNYFITRANALENNIRFYSVKDGKRQQLASWDGIVTLNKWHEYQVEIRGDEIRIFWDGKEVLKHRDSTFSMPGRAGLWTKADSVTAFDDFTVEPL